MARVRTAVVPAAGSGTRMLPASEAVPKELFPVGGVPALQWVLDEAESAGIERLVVVSSPRKPEIAAYLTGRRPAFGEFELVVQQEPLGLGDAIRVARHAVGDEPFAVLLPDEILLGGGRLLGEMLDAFSHHGRSVVSAMAVDREEIAAYGVIVPAEPKEPDGPSVVGCVEKPDPESAPSLLALSGRYVLGRDVLDVLDGVGPGAKGEVQLTDGLDRAARSAGIDSVDVREDDGRVDVGNWQGWLDANVRTLAETP